MLVACEESQRVCLAFRTKGHNAYSCDVLECSGGYPQYHIQQDIFTVLYGKTLFFTMDGIGHYIDKWDMIIAFPPCTHLAVSGAVYFEQKRKDGRQRDAIEFFSKFLDVNCDRVAIENPVGIISGEYIRKWFPDLANQYDLPRKYSQIIQPYEFGHNVAKKTCLWLKNLPLLTPTNIVEPERIHSKGRTGGYSGPSWYVKDENGKILSWNDPRTARERSKTYQGIADAMAEQWGKEIIENV